MQCIKHRLCIKLRTAGRRWNDSGAVLVMMVGKPMKKSYIRLTTMEKYAVLIKCKQLDLGVSVSSKQIQKVHDAKTKA